MAVRTYLDCGCAILDDGSRSRCPSCSWEIEKFEGEQMKAIDYQATLAARPRNTVGECLGV